jgi:hypothetical protein
MGRGLGLAANVMFGSDLVQVVTVKGCTGIFGLSMTILLQQTESYSKLPS